jgi:branched-chain amino acid transport system permease protein
LKKSDASNLARLPPTAGVGAGLPPATRSLFANLPVPLAILAIVALGRWVVTGETIGRYNYEVVMQVGVAIVMAVSLQLINGYSGQFSLGHAGFMAVGAYLSGYPAVAYSRNFADPAAVLLFYFALLLSVGIGAGVLVGLFLAARRSRRFHPSLPMVLLIAIFAWVIFDIAKAGGYEKPPAWLVFTRGTALLGNLFESVLMSGAPAAAKLSGVLPQWLLAPLTFLLLLAGGGLCAAAAGLVVGLPTLRLRGDYLAITTLGFGEIIRVAIQNTTPLGGPLGLGGIPNYTDFAWLYAAALVTIIAVWRIAYSARGRAIEAVREDEIAAASIGVDPTRQKVLAFVVGAFFAGVGGALYGHYTGFITPTDFGFQRSIEFVVMVTLGGLASVSGAVLAAIVLTLLPELLRNADDFLPAAIRQTGFKLSDWRLVLYALLLIAMMLIRPQGLLGGKEIWPRSWRRRQVSPAAPGAATPKAEPTTTLEGEAPSTDTRLPDRTAGRVP